MNPFYFGSSAEPLFGVFHPPNAAAGRSVGVVLCYPMGQEYMRAHRAFRQLALLLSRSGFPVLRFDYFGTGDSAGDAQDASAERWIADIGTAMDEMKDTADVSTLAVVGLRLGATLGAYAAARRSDVSHLVLWDSIWSGKAYMEEVLAEQSGAVNGRRFRRRAPDPETVGIMGFPLTRALRNGIETLQLRDVTADSPIESFIVVSNEAEQQKTEAELQGKKDRGRFICVPSPGNWNEVDNFGSALIPQAIIREIVKYLSSHIPA